MVVRSSAGKYIEAQFLGQSTQRLNGKLTSIAPAATVAAKNPPATDAKSNPDTANRNAPATDSSSRKRTFTDHAATIEASLPITVLTPIAPADTVVRSALNTAAVARKV